MCFLQKPDCAILHVLIPFTIEIAKAHFCLERLDYRSSSHVSHVWQHMPRWSAWICLRVLNGLLIENRLDGKGTMQLTQRQITLLRSELMYTARIALYYSTYMSYSMHSYVDDWRRCINRSPKTSLEVLFHVCPFDIGQYPAPLPRKHTSWDIAAKVVDTVLHMWHSRAIVQFHYVTTRWLERPVWHRNDMTRYTVDFDPSSHGYSMNI